MARGGSSPSSISRGRSDHAAAPGGAMEHIRHAPAPWPRGRRSVRLRHLAIATVLVTVCLEKALEPAHETVNLTFLAVRQPLGRPKADEKRRLRGLVVCLAVEAPQAAEIMSLPVNPEAVAPVSEAPCLCEAEA